MPLARRERPKQQALGWNFSQPFQDGMESPVPGTRSVDAGAVFREGALVISIVAIAIVLRLLHLGRLSLDIDEAASFSFANQAWRAVARSSFAEGPVMPLYYMGLHLWMALGTSEFMLRLPSVVFSVSTVPVLYSLGKRLFSSRVGATAALLFAIHGVSIQYAQQARSYSLVVLLASLSYLYFLKFLDRPHLDNWIGWVLASVLTIYAHPLAAALVPAQWAWLFFIRPKRGCGWSFVAAGLAIILTTVPLIFVPLIFSFAGAEHGQWNWIPETSFHRVHDLVLFLAGWVDGTPRILGTLLLLLYLISGAAALMDFTAAARASREVPHSYGLLLLGVCIPVGLILMASLYKPLLVPRYFLVSLPTLILLVSAGICCLRPTWLLGAVLVVFAAIAIREDLCYYTYFFKPDYRSAISYVLSNSRPDDKFISFYPAPFTYYRQRLQNLNAMPQMRSPSVWLIVLPEWGSKAEHAKIARMRQDLAGDFPSITKTKFRAVTVYRYARPQGYSVTDP